MNLSILKKVKNKLLFKDVHVLDDRQFGKYKGEYVILPYAEEERFDAVNIDIKNACNLRCRFCFNHFEDSIDQLSADQQKAIIPILDLTRKLNDGPGCGVYLSCLYEPTIAGSFLSFLGMIPPSGREKCFFTSNFARPMNEEYIQKLLNANVHHINISIETLESERYQTITSRTCFDSFRKNLELLSECYPKKEGYKPGLRFITMVLKENKEEILDILHFCHERFQGCGHELRTPYLSQYENMDWNRSQLLPRSELSALRKTIEKTGYPLDMDLRPVEDLEVIDPQALAGAVTEESKPDRLEQFCREICLCMNPEYLFVRFQADGTIRENATGLTEPIPSPEEAGDYYRQKLRALYERRADAFVCPYTAEQDNLKMVPLEMMLEKTVVNDHYLQLTGWCRIPDEIPESSIMLFCTKEETEKKGSVFFALQNERPDVPVTAGKRSVGFTTCIKKDRVSQEQFRFSVVFAEKELKAAFRWDCPYAVRMAAHS